MLALTVIVSVTLCVALDFDVLTAVEPRATEMLEELVHIVEAKSLTVMDVASEPLE